MGLESSPDAPGMIRADDRRLYPRKECNLRDRQNQIIRNISFGGVCLESHSPYKTGQELNLEFRLPTGDSIRADSEVVRVEGSGFEDRQRYGCSLTRLGSRDRRTLKKYLLNRLKKDELASLRSRFMTGLREQVVEVREPNRVKSLLKGALESRANLVIYQEESQEAYLEGKMLRVDEEKIRIKSSLKISADTWSLSKPFSVYFDYAFHGYFFETRLEEVLKGELCFRMPSSICYTDKRNHVRKHAAEGRLEFPVPYPRGANFSAPLLEFSEGGASFEAAMEGWYFLPGTPLKGLRLHSENHTRDIDRAEVKYIVPFGEHAFRVGVEFCKTGRSGIEVTRETFGKPPAWLVPLKSAYQKLSVGAKLFLSRRKSEAVREAEDLRKIRVVRYRNERGHEIVALVNSSIPLNGKPVKAPVIIIPPAYGKRKETTLGLAMTLTENFRKQGKPVVVIRLDFTNALGESDKDEAAREEGRHYVCLSPVTCMKDILATFDYAWNNPAFIPTETILVSFSYTSPMARRAIMNDSRQRVSYWINVNGTPHMQELIKNASGGIDYVGNVFKGQVTGLVNFLGEMLDGTLFCQDAISARMAFLDEAREDLAALKIPVTWIYAKYDSWVNPDAIRDVMSVRADARRDIVEVPTGHLPSTSEEAFGNFRVVTKLVWSFLHKDPVEVVDPDLALFVEMMQRERDRLPKAGPRDRKDYWKTYLVGEKEKDLGIDILSMTDDYQQLMATQIDLLELSPEDVIADIGSGTGNFLRGLKNHPALGQRPMENLVHLIDFIPEALERGLEKSRDIQETHKRMTFQTHVVDLELSRLLPFARYYRGEYAGLRELKGKVEGIPDYVFDQLESVYDSHLHRVLRGKPLTESDFELLEARLSPSDMDLVVEFGQASRLARQAIEAGSCEEMLQEMRFERLQLGRHLGQFRYPFSSESIDKILCSIVLSYIFNPQEVICEMFRMLKPGGTVVLSSFRPDADMTLSYSRMIKKIEKMESSPVPGYSRDELLQAVRDYANSAAALLRFGEDGAFRFFTEEELRQMVVSAGFCDINFVKSFGDPPQVIVCSAKKILS